MTSVKIAIPSNAPGGLEAGVSAHFGHCDLYTIVEADGSDLKSVTTLPNPPHEEGGCLAPVQLLAKQGVRVLLAGGMGRRPLMGFTEAGIQVFFAGLPTVGESVQALLEGRLPAFTMDGVCGGCGGH
ncbi:MAG: NifB/NifX family molybdenum-iron cluster-binding protein [Candidatus Adiutrix sp.]|jgi:predicted Fe-Mo cluster-binding NifX family protein|nr:NifB/NifX family molybdenum-iron cluster-binding protein [Candidatus Adiutrix sp.]